MAAKTFLESFYNSAASVSHDQFDVLVSDGKQGYSVFVSLPGDCYPALIEKHCSYTRKTVAIMSSAATMQSHTVPGSLHTCITEKQWSDAPNRSHQANGRFRL